MTEGVGVGLKPVVLETPHPRQLVEGAGRRAERFVQAEEALSQGDLLKATILVSGIMLDGQGSPLGADILNQFEDGYQANTNLHAKTGFQEGKKQTKPERFNTDILLTQGGIAGTDVAEVVRAQQADFLTRLADAWVDYANDTPFLQRSDVKKPSGEFHRGATDSLGPIRDYLSLMFAGEKPADLTEKGVESSTGMLDLKQAITALRVMPLLVREATSHDLNSTGVAELLTPQEMDARLLSVLEQGNLDVGSALRFGEALAQSYKEITVETDAQMASEERWARDYLSTPHDLLANADLHLKSERILREIDDKRLKRTQGQINAVVRATANATLRSTDTAWVRRGETGQTETAILNADRLYRAMHTETVSGKGTGSEFRSRVWQSASDRLNQSLQDGLFEWQLGEGYHMWDLDLDEYAKAWTLVNSGNINENTAGYIREKLTSEMAIGSLGAKLAFKHREEIYKAPPAYKVGFLSGKLSDELSYLGGLGLSDELVRQVLYGVDGMVTKLVGDITQDVLGPRKDFDPQADRALFGTKIAVFGDRVLGELRKDERLSDGVFGPESKVFLTAFQIMRDACENHTGVAVRPTQSGGYLFADTVALDEGLKIGNQAGRVHAVAVELRRLSSTWPKETVGVDWQRAYISEDQATVALTGAWIDRLMSEARRVAELRQKTPTILPFDQIGAFRSGIKDMERVGVTTESIGEAILLHKNKLFTDIRAGVIVDIDTLLQVDDTTVLDGAIGRLADYLWLEDLMARLDQGDQVKNDQDRFSGSERMVGVIKSKIAQMRESGKLNADKTPALMEKWLARLDGREKVLSQLFDEL